MAAINTALVAREAISTLVKRKSWPAENAGVMVVFCIVFVGMQSDAFPPIFDPSQFAMVELKGNRHGQPKKYESFC